MDDLVSTPQAAAQVGKTDRRLRQLCEAGAFFSARKIGRNWVLKLEEVKEYFRGRK